MKLTKTIMAATRMAEGETTQLKFRGWVDAVRNHGKLTFFDLRDYDGVIQCVARGLSDKLNIEDVIEIVGTLNKRPEKMINPNLPTGEYEVVVQDLRIINKCKALPIPVEGDGREISEEMRLQYRYLDLRRNRMARILKMRSEFIYWLCDDLNDQEFVNVETPLLSKATKEGARDFVIPSRLHPGHFYALPQSPQQYKQLLMTAGVQKYYQIARCVRDENLRADRGFEFTQLDLEIAWAEENDVRKCIEQALSSAISSIGLWWKVVEGERPFPVITYNDAMQTYGTDKPDLRTEEDKKEGRFAFCWVIRHPMFKKVDKDDAAEVEDGKSGWTFTHNPFSRPVEDHEEWHLKGDNINKIISTQYDLVCNGLEVGGGSLRAYTSESLRATFRIMGYTDEEINDSVGHMLTAFDLGTPPHGGIALGIDRLLMLFAGEASLKEVIAFPMTNTGRTSVMNAPSKISPSQFKELHLNER